MNKKRISLNGLTDTGFLFEVGNSLIGFIASFQAGLISLSIASLCILARVSGEVRKDDVSISSENLIYRLFMKGVLSPLGKLVVLMSKNLGTSLIISGCALMIASLFAVQYGSMETILSSKEALILALFGVANATRGIARGVKEQSTLQKCLDTIGIVLAALGVVLAGQAITLSDLQALNFDILLNIFVKIGFAMAAILAIYQAVKSLPTRGFLQPDLVFAAACIGNAVLVYNQPFLMIANLLFALAFVSLDALKKKNGFYELYCKS